MHEIKNEILQDYTVDLELNGVMIIRLIEHKTNIRSEIMDAFESYINTKDIDFDSEDVTFTGYSEEVLLNMNTILKKLNLNLLIQ